MPLVGVRIGELLADGVEFVDHLLEFAQGKIIRKDFFWKIMMN